MTTYVDILNSDGLVADTGAFDDTFWNNNQDQLNAYAKAHGTSLDVRGNTAASAPAGTVRAINNMAQFQSWVNIASLQPQDAGANPTAGAVNSSMSTGEIVAIAGAVVVTAIAIAIAIARAR